jgi:hypothetical protein
MAGRISHRGETASRRVQSDSDTEGRPMAGKRKALCDWHRLFGLLLTDRFIDSQKSNVST